MTALDDAIDQLRRHRGISRVGDPEFVEGGNGGWLVEIDIPVELPSRARAAGISATGVKTCETCTLAFNRWPLQAPRPYLRPDFPRDLPHINPHREGIFRRNEYGRVLPDSSSYKSTCFQCGHKFVD